MKGDLTEADPAFAPQRHVLTIEATDAVGLAKLDAYRMLLEGQPGLRVTVTNLGDA